MEIVLSYTKKIKLNFYFFALFLFANVSFISSQSINLSGFSVFQNEKSALLLWNIESGSTCNGITIFHSIDMTNFNEIGSIYGVCGSSSKSTPYNFTHTNPALNKINYYKLKFGSSQYSEIIFLLFDYVETGNLLINPNPANDFFDIKFNNDKNQTFTVEIIDANGQFVLTKNKITGTSFTVNSSLFDAGIYTVVLRDAEGSISKNKLCIIR